MTNIRTRGRTFTGVVTSDSMRKTVTVEWTGRHYIPKYERYAKRRTRVKAHNPEDVDAQVGDEVVIRETRPLSKTKHYAVIRKAGEEPASKEKDTGKEKAPAQKETTGSSEGASATKKSSSKKTTKKTTKKSTSKKSTTKKSTTKSES